MTGSQRAPGESQGVFGDVPKFRSISRLHSPQSKGLSGRRGLLAGPPQAGHALYLPKTCRRASPRQGALQGAGGSHTVARVTTTPHGRVENTDHWVLDAVGLEWGPRIFVSNKFPGNADVIGLETSTSKTPGLAIHLVPR